MPHPKSIFLSFLVATTTILAMPNMIPAHIRSVFPYSTIHARSESPTAKADCETAGVYICEDVGFKGSCTLYHNCTGSAPSACTVLDGKASAIGPDVGFSCNLYRSDNCRATPGVPDSVLTLKFPGEGYLTNRGWNDAVRSYQCFKD
ncbi:hypothetical protein K505DRAFT_417066 [Melanomma pulvis-pyrius CBS 109.77]|uniref:Uncharacterized protein n=1 Tax=Melanomma pulvis-pyrius CBS 109.77 TaxID=1314802 RepID=A0A6A6XEK8_9PLEO|nr:hypothetical protein K505DRAFT_417066 [Melanomma pulvis-pyrius CBS 109.77]